MIKNNQQSDSALWVKPEIVSLKPVEAAEGDNTGKVGDGTVNLTA
ncbi:hypothetical protein [Alteraurantiacibacter buctensis]|nr:hypothetical protein [Alteraurantiacibacter buctensis]